MEKAGSNESRALGVSYLVTFFRWRSELDNQDIILRSVVIWKDAMFCQFKATKDFGQTIICTRACS